MDKLLARRENLFNAVYEGKFNVLKIIFIVFLEKKGWEIKIIFLENFKATLKK